MSAQNQEKRRRTALVTGASGGIGLELAQLFARDGFNLVLVARSQEKLAALAADLRAKHAGTVTVQAQDLARPEAPPALAADLAAAGIAVDVLVNNAGFATHGPFAEIPYADEAEEMQVNMVAPTYLTKLFLPGMIDRGWGKILNVASTAAFQAGPLMAVYYASKAYLLSLSEALAEETRGTGVTVTALCPGATETGFARRANVEQTRLFQGTTMDAVSVAAAGYRGLMRGQILVVPGRRNQLMAQATRLAPRRLAARMVMAAQK